MWEEGKGEESKEGKKVIKCGKNRACMPMAYLGIARSCLLEEMRKISSMYDFQLKTKRPHIYE